MSQGAGIVRAPAIDCPALNTVNLPLTSDRAARAGWGRGVAAVLLMLAVYYLIQWLTGVLAIYPHLGLPEDLGRGSFVAAFDHHFWQMALALAAIGLLGRGRWREWGLNLRNREESIRLLGKFVFVYGVYFLGIGFVLQLAFTSPSPPGHPMTTAHIVGRLAFGFLFVGASEEILFRGLIHTYLGRYWKGVWRWRDWELPAAGLIAALLFTLAHVGLSFGPFRITHLYAPQLAMAFVLGIFYSVAYHRTGSLLAPILAHNFSDGALWASEYLLFWLAGSGGSGAG